LHIDDTSYNPSRGFTLAEAALAIGVVAILAGIIVPLVLKALQDARYARARNDIQVIVAAIASQLKDTGGRPVADGGVQVGRADGSLDAPWFSDHLCFTAVGHAHMHDLIPLPFSSETVCHVVPRVREVQERVGRPFLLENPSYYVRMPVSGDPLDEADFFVEVAERADCGILLDVNNVYVNSQNHGFDPYRFIDAIPAGRVLQLHLAGHERQGDVIIDTHSARVIPPVWDLYRHTLARIGAAATLCEWDNAIPSLDEVIDEAERARACQATTASRAAG